MYIYRTMIPALALGLLLAAGCQKAAGDAPPPAAEAKAAAKPAGNMATKPAAGTSKVARIVFVDKGKACACTKERIDASWKALTEVTGWPPVPDLERIHMDTDPNKAAPYKAKKAIMVAPAIYFFDAGDKLLQVLQGEVTVEQVKAALN